MNKISNSLACEVTEILATICSLQRKGKKIFATSSFQSHSVALLHILSQLEEKIPVYFVNTGFLFPETIQFRDAVAERFDIEVLEIGTTIPKIQQLNRDGNFFFTSDPGRCCYINKVEPVNQLLIQYDAWISGIRADQTDNRRSLEIFMEAPNDCLRYHPMLDWTEAAVENYLQQHELPRHPLEKEGYRSIGCQPCTAKDFTSSRDGRWSGMNKTECGLHTDLDQRGRGC